MYPVPFVTVSVTTLKRSNISTISYLNPPINITESGRLKCNYEIYFLPTWVKTVPSPVPLLLFPSFSPISYQTHLITFRRVKLQIVWKASRTQKDNASARLSYDYRVGINETKINELDRMLIAAEKCCYLESLLDIVGCASR